MPLSINPIRKRVLIQALREYLNARVPEAYDASDSGEHVREYIARRYGALPKSFQDEQFSRVLVNVNVAMILERELSE